MQQTVAMLQRNQELFQQQQLSPGSSTLDIESLSHDMNSNSKNVRSRSIMGNMTTAVDFDIAQHLTELESELPPMPSPSPLSPAASSSLPGIFNLHLMAVFFDRIHQWYPIFDRQSFEADYLLASNQALVPSSRSCMFLMVTAIGHLTLSLESGRANENNLNECASVAFQMLHLVLSASTLPAAQCMILCGIYHLLCFRPIQACEHLNSASYKLQNLYRQKGQRQHVVNTELYRRAFYAVCILERQLLVYIDLAGFGVSDWQENIPLPSGTFENGNTDEGPPIEFYLAEIAMNKIMERADRNLATNLIQRPGESRPPDNPRNRKALFFANVVAKEIDFQISEWRKHLPFHVAFPVQGTCPSEMSTYLKVQYHAIICGVYWHALYQASVMEDRSPDVTSACQKCLDSFHAFIDSTEELLSEPISLPQISMTLASVFAISLAVISVRDAPASKDVGPLQDSCTRAWEMLRRYSGIYPATWRWADVLASKLDSLGR